MLIVPAAAAAATTLQLTNGCYLYISQNILIYICYVMWQQWLSAACRWITCQTQQTNALFIWFLHPPKMSHIKCTHSRSHTHTHPQTTCAQIACNAQSRSHTHTLTHTVNALRVLSAYENKEKQAKYIGWWRDWHMPIYKHISKANNRK